MSGDSSPITLEAWLETRLSDVPVELAEAVRARTRGCLEDDEVALVSAALAGFDSVADGIASRPSALELLAADALLTYAFEAASDPRRGGSADRAIRLADQVGPRGWIGERFGPRERFEGAVTDPP